MFIKKIYEHKLDQYRQKINTEIRQIIDTHTTDAQIRAMLHYAVESGRRFRPLLFLLSYKIFIREIPTHCYQLAAAVELLHKASLIHDDLIDGDSYRRGKASFYHTYGERTAIITGDLLVSLAFEQFIEHTDDRFLNREWAKLYRRLAMGEMQDVVWEGNWSIGEAELRAMIDGKTASFLEFVMLAGGYLATGDQATAAKMGEFGREIGFAFQIINDLNNWHGLEQELGRNPQGDMTAGKVNLVTKLVREYASVDDVVQNGDVKRNHDVQHTVDTKHSHSADKYCDTLLSRLGKKRDTMQSRNTGKHHDVISSCGIEQNRDTTQSCDAGQNLNTTQNCGAMQNLNTTQNCDTRQKSDTKKFETEVMDKVKSLAEEHINAARQILANIGVTNQYTLVLQQLLNEFDEKWFWVDRDDK